MELSRNELANLLAITVEGTRRGANLVKAHFGKVNLQQADFKGASDYVSDVDRESEEVIKTFFLQELNDSVFLGEELGQTEGEGRFRWVVDPLDGTTNFLQGFPIVAVSAALEERGEGTAWGRLLTGAVMHPLTGELWTAARGQGAHKGDHSIRISSKRDLPLCLIATGFPFRAKSELKDYLRTFELMFMNCSGIRRAGAAALDLCWTADGTFDGFWEHHLSAWDIAAGALIIEEAGGRFTSFNGGHDFLTSGNVVGANPLIHARMLEIIQTTLGPPYL